MRIGIFDSSALIHMATQKREKPHVLKYFIDTVATIIDKLELEYIIIGNDLYKSRYRQGLLPNYKGVQEKKSKKEIERTKLVHKYRANLERLFGDTFCYAGVDHVEFDDVASLLVKDFGKEHDITIISSDRDILQTGAKQFCPKKMEFLKIPDGLTPNQWIQYKMMVSDSSDKLSNTKGIGKVYGTKILQTYGSIQEALKHTDPDPRINKLLDLMRSDEGMAQLKMSYRLVKLFTDYKNMNDSEIKQYEKIKQEVSKCIVKSFQATEDVEDAFSELGYFRGTWQLELLVMNLRINRGE